MGNKGELGVSAPTLPATGVTGRRWTRLPVTGGLRLDAGTELSTCGGASGEL